MVEYEFCRSIFLSVIFIVGAHHLNGEDSCPQDDGHRVCVDRKRCDAFLHFEEDGNVSRDETAILEKYSCTQTKGNFSRLCCPVGGILNTTRDEIIPTISSDTNKNTSGDPCQKYNGQRVCVDIQLCKPLRKLREDDYFTFDEWSVLEKYDCGPKDSIFKKMCCNLDGLVDVDDAIKPPELPSLTNKSTSDMEFCKMRNGSRGACVAVSACAAYVELLKGGQDLMEGLQVTQENACGFQGLETKVCCPLNDPDLVSETIDPREGVLTPEDYVSALPEPPECGRDDSGPRSADCRTKQQFLLNGKPAYRGISRWMALLYYQNAAVPWQCGGTIISSRHVLTAAHCIKPNLYLVRVGEIDYDDRMRYDGNPADYLIKKAIPHENYSKQNNDIGVLVLQEHIQFNEYVNAICLPIPTTSYRKIKVGRGAMIEGWGVTESGQTSSHLQYTHLSLVDQKTCKEVYSDTSATIDDRVLCAGADQTDACKGDSGSPLLESYCLSPKGDNFQDWYYQYGIVSYGFPCSRSRFVGIYTSVEHFMPWIEEKVLGKHRGVLKSYRNATD